MIKYNRIKDLREDHDYKQEEIAKYLEVERSVYAKWENGDRNIPLSKVAVSYTHLTLPTTERV